jgi:hypothetical protein
VKPNQGVSARANGFQIGDKQSYVTIEPDQQGFPRSAGLSNLVVKMMDEAAREQRGVVQGFTGDGIMAIFGAPIALEDAPPRACRAALSQGDGRNHEQVHRRDAVSMIMQERPPALG